MFNTRNPERITGCHKVGHRSQYLQSIYVAIRIRGTNH